MIPVNRPRMDGNELQLVTNCITDGWISSEGDFVRKFELDMALLCDRRHAIAVCNGSMALMLAIKALDLPTGSEIIVPSFTIISCVNAVYQNGLKPVFVDCDETWNMDVQAVNEAVTPNTSAILMVHIYGLMTDYTSIKSIAELNGLKLIEDAAEAHGQYCGGYIAGSMGDVSIFSFYPNKNITTGEGGMVLTNDDRIMERARHYMNLCFDSSRNYIHDDFGWNMRMTNLQAAIGVAQLPQLELALVRRKEIANIYRSHFERTDNIDLPIHKTAYCDNGYWVFGILLKNEDIRDGLMAYLKSNKIGTRKFFFPLHKQPCVIREFGVQTACENAENISERGMYLPSGLGNTNPEIHYVSQLVKDYINAI